jgi:hypothetical protein
MTITDATETRPANIIRKDGHAFNLDMFYPVLDKPCTECPARAHEPCTDGVVLDVETGRYLEGMVAYRPAGEHNAHGRAKDGTGPKWDMVHTSRVSKAKTPRAERLPASEKAGAKALAQEDGSDGGKRPVYVAVHYASLGNEGLCFIAGPMTSAAAGRLCSDMADPTNVVPGTYARVISAADMTTAVETGNVGGRRLVTLPSQLGYVVRCGEDDEMYRVTQRRPVPVQVAQESWLDAIAV